VRGTQERAQLSASRPLDSALPNLRDMNDDSDSGRYIRVGVEKSAYHQLSHFEIGRDNPLVVGSKLKF
jgi:hypothetical protein